MTTNKEGLTTQERTAVLREKEQLEPTDLYRALHHVGDDPVKSSINTALKDMLDEDSYKIVVAIFNLGTDWKFLTGGG